MLSEFNWDTKCDCSTLQIAFTLLVTSSTIDSFRTHLVCTEQQWVQRGSFKVFYMVYSLGKIHPKWIIVASYKVCDYPECVSPITEVLLIFYIAIKRLLYHFMRWMIVIFTCKCKIYVLVMYKVITLILEMIR